MLMKFWFASTIHAWHKKICQEKPKMRQVARKAVQG
jgi:hypothetical protein